eukprot:401703-Amphidinium_carterae.1
MDTLARTIEGTDLHVWTLAKITELPMLYVFGTTGYKRCKTQLYRMTFEPTFPYDEADTSTYHSPTRAPTN